LNLQVKLLNVLQEKEVYRIGGTKPIEINARIISSTNKDLKKMVVEDKFRKDLFYRLNVVPIKIPSVRERLEDLPLLSCHYIEIYNKKYGKNKKLTAEAYKVLLKHSWPGNVRELQNTIERMVVTSDNSELKAQDVLNNIDIETIAASNIPNGFGSLKAAREKFEIDLILRTIEKVKSTRKAAEILKVDQSTIVKKLKRYKSNLSN
jgi:transcriptional regulator with PAS, ATPase and Fis domain